MAKQKGNRGKPDNVTDLPGTEHRKAGERPVLTFDNDFLRNLCFGDEWLALANELAGKSELISYAMRGFVEQMAARKRRPSPRQLGLLVGLFVDVKTQEILEEMERPARAAAETAAREAKLRRAQAIMKHRAETMTNVVPLRPHAGRARSAAAGPGPAA